MWMKFIFCVTLLLLLLLLLCGGVDALESSVCMAILKSGKDKHAEKKKIFPFSHIFLLVSQFQRPCECRLSQIVSPFSLARLA
jgi:hypothetical protein